ncbi:MAG: TIGR01777 family oxidoreductase [Verrucomicrobiota bacterium]
MTQAKTILIAGGSGFLGKALASHFNDAGAEVHILTRGDCKTHKGVHYHHWDGTALGPWTDLLEKADVLINLAGKSVNCRYTKANKAEILKSRTKTTHTLSEALARAETPPKVWLNASTATIYADSKDAPNDDETHHIGNGFSVSVARSWENALFSAPHPGVRKVALRTAMVLGEAENSVYPVLKRQTRFGLGGHHGSGQQMVSWIHIEDFIRAIVFVIENDELAGPINIAAPAPVTDATFMSVFRKTLHAPFGIPTPKPILKLGAFLLRTEPELILKSRNVIPSRLLKHRFQFKYPFIDEALASL